MKFGQTNEFVKRYGDSGEDEFEGRGGTIPQRLLMMNGDMVRERLKADGYRSRGRTASAPWLVARAGAGFFKSYVLKAGFLDGTLGVVSALSLAVDATTALAMATADPR